VTSGPEPTIGHAGPSGTRVRFRSWGQNEGAPWVVLIQGLGLSGKFWFEQPARLARAGYRVVTLDNRGTGDSDPVTRPFRLRAYADDVARVMDAVGIERADVVGISMGGMIAQHVAIRHEARLTGLVLLATTPGLPHGRLTSPRAISKLASLPFVRDGGRTAASLLLSRRDLPRAKELLAPFAPAFAEHPIRPRTFFLQLGAIAAHSTASRLRRVQVPAVVVAGSDDVLVPPAASRALADALPNAQFELLPDVGHAIPTAVPDVVERSLARLRG
jgi:pimeloyl-ACP methyl ester carboxylesterase